jgi:hypothetical protein
MTLFSGQPDLALELERGLIGGSEAASEELLRLVRLAGQIQASTRSIAPTPSFRSGARGRLIAHMARSRAPRIARDIRLEFRDRLMWWLMRLGVALTGVSVAGVAAASASASALPGDALYTVKQAGEQIELQLAPSDAARALLLIDQADTRLDEAALLIQQGRAADAAEVERRYADMVAYAVALASGDAGGTTDVSRGQMVKNVNTALESQDARLTTMLAESPMSARPGLDRARSAAERSLTHAAPSASPEAEPPVPERHQHTDSETPAPELPTGHKQGGSASPDVAALPGTGRNQPEASAHAAAAQAEPGRDQNEAAADTAGNRHVPPAANPPSRGRSRAEPPRQPKR